MTYDLQKAGLWKRMAAWMFDMILLSIAAVGIGVLLSALLGYDGHSIALEQGYVAYESQYGVDLRIDRAAYEAMTPENQALFNEAHAALAADEDVLYHYNMMLSLTLVIVSVSILLAYGILEFFVPLRLQHGRTLGKKIFGLCLVREDGVKVNTLQLFVRTILGKYTVETMIPVLIVLMIFWGTMGVMGTAVLLALLCGQLASICFTRANCAIHDLMAGTAVVDFASQSIFDSPEAKLEWQKKLAADRAARQVY